MIDMFRNAKIAAVIRPTVVRSLWVATSFGIPNCTNSTIECG